MNKAFKGKFYFYKTF